MKKTGAILLGLGRIASILEKDPYRQKPCTHAGVLLSDWGKRNFTLNCGFDPNLEKREGFAKQWGFSESKLYSILEKENLADSTPDLAIIATPSESHFDHALWAIKSGISNLLIEKPICDSLDKVKKLKELVEKHSVKVWVNHERRFHPKYQWAKRILDSGKYGKIRTIRASVLTSALAPGRAYTGKVGPLFHDGTHALDLVHWLVGMPDQITSTIRKRKSLPIEDSVTAILEYKNGQTVFLEVGGSRRYFQFELDIMTESARIILSNDGFQFFKSLPSKKYKGFNSLTEAPFPEKSSLGSNPFRNLYSEIRSVLTGKSDTITGSFYDNLEIMELLNRIKVKAKIQIVSET
ncbi:oxidoreductase [Leptospira perolatii]|uniref:Oxidoreductase n=1 Tax=Leptospira perolatii TaxID=2023191 RepID=A0A2M9ZKJ5_9LEPT|nr:Gfo/Idh/MocA family oxidoreductase [Leptospira perolatii]PJZ69423.1 oxidoreductase [Leptospira perolatii]PJZ72577.1 oxidoreductase [Leptospira perolatii]